MMSILFSILSYCFFLGCVFFIWFFRFYDKNSRLLVGILFAMIGHPIIGIILFFAAPQPKIKMIENKSKKKVQITVDSIPKKVYVVENRKEVKT